jgi:hypothetical protein
MENSAKALISRALNLKSDNQENKDLIKELKAIQNAFQKFDYDFKPINYFDFPLGNNESYSESLKMLGKEFLRELRENEVEIARLEMASTTQDVYSIIASPTKNRILYHIEDEYETDFWPGIKSSKEPLTFKKLIKLIDSTSTPDHDYIFGAARDYNYEDSYDKNPEDYSHFESLDSRFYPELYEYYELQNDLWLIEKKIEIIEETLIPIKIDIDLLNLKDAKGQNILERIYLDLQKNDIITDDEVPQYINYKNKDEDEILEVIRDEITKEEFSKTINIDIPKMNSYFKEWIDMWGGEEAHKPPFSDDRISEIEKGSEFTPKEFEDLKEWMSEIEQQSITYDGKASERCKYALFETLNKNTFIFAEHVDDAETYPLGFFKDEVILREYLNKSYYLY